MARTSDADTSFSTILSQLSQPAGVAHLSQPLKIPQTFLRRSKSVRDVDWVFKSVFKRQKYKGMQREVMQASLNGVDIVVIAPTGMGKSLCFQVPAIAEEHGMTIVVSPLLSLMKDQIQALKALGCAAEMLSSKTPFVEQEEILQDMESGHPKTRLLYVTPERLSSPSFKRRLDILHKHKELMRLVVDEAHCISEWGHDFRPDYAKLNAFRCEYPKIPIMCLTASATPKVQDDIAAEMGLNPDSLLKVVHSFNRHNLFYEVRYYSEVTMPSTYRRDDLLPFIQKISKGRTDPNGQVIVSRTPGIIYCRAKRTCDELATWLRGQGIAAAPYHRGLKDSEADETQARWISEDDGSERKIVDCIVATVAFGMGIDKGNCRYVVHYDIPKSFEGFYQETGRAGRDGHAARTILYYAEEDRARVQALVERSYDARVKKANRRHEAEPSQRAPSSMLALFKFAMNVTVCRHVLICRYFGELDVEPAVVCARMCDVCKGSTATRARRDRGLVCLDFQQTQAIFERGLDEFEEPNPDEYYPNEAKASDEDGSEDGSEGEEQGEKHEGFRTAKNEMERAQEMDEEGSSPRGIRELCDATDSEEEVPPTQRPVVPASPELEDQEVELVVLEEHREKKKTDVELLFLPSSDGEELPVPAKMPLVKPALAGGSGVNRTGDAGPVAPQGTSGLKANPSITGLIRPKFVPPMTNNSIRDSGQLVSSGPTSLNEAPIKYVLEPDSYEKKIPRAMRDSAVEHFVEYLGQGLLSKHGKRSSASEEQVWSELGGGGSTHEKRRQIISAAAVGIESDLFWIATTPAGYRQFLSARSEAVKSLTAQDDPLPKESVGTVYEVVDAVRRATKRLGKEKKRKK